MIQYVSEKVFSFERAMTHKVDRVDQAIVRLLSEDGRMSSAEIARRIGHVSERSVRYRINRLIQEGVIQVSAVVNPRALGFTVTADIFIEVEPGHVLDVARAMAEFECVSYVGCSTGERDVSIQVYARDNEELYRFVTEVVGNVPWVRKTSTMLLPLVLKDVYDLHIPNSACVDGKEGEK
jgi:Lrp/AsnC family transcriptional regulator for asnA, asnC and gidA